MSQTTGRTKTLRTSRNAIKIINQADLHAQAVQLNRTLRQIGATSVAVASFEVLRPRH